MAEAIPAEHWHRIHEIFHGAVELPAGEREAYVTREASGDEALRREVASLLAAEDRPLSLLDGSALDVLVDAVGEPPSVPHPAGRVGRYRLLRLLAQGGMGSVYLARRDDHQYRQQVAVKILRHSLADPHAVDRHLRERQILADLTHPNIARLLDGGVTGEGLPYLVLELIDGEPIDRYCDQRELSVEERIRLFCAVCSAVSHAHRHLVVHRDLKPSNVLITAEGVPKLLDFGIAKLLDPAASGAATTLPGLRPMTPDYASPEQVLGRPVTTASDVYSLGLLLYKLLTGRLPFRLAGLSPQEVTRVICEQPPGRPSTALSRSGGGASSRRGEKAERRLRGDLDTIVLKALRKEPERRYPGAAQLAEDLERHLAGLPVSARRDTWSYRAGKFLRRHRLAAAAVLVVVASLLAGSAATWWQAREARARQVQAERTLDLLIDVLRVSDPDQARGEQVMARELLDRAAEEIGGHLAGEPRVQSRLRTALGEIYLNLGFLDRAEALLREALRSAGAAGAPTRETLKIGNLLGFVYIEQDRYELAERILTTSLDTVRRTLGPEHPLALEAMNELGALHARQGRFTTAETFLTRVLEIRRRGPETDPSEAVTLRLHLAQTVAWQGRYREAEALVLEALEIDHRELGEDHPETLLALNSLGALYLEVGRYGEAERILERLLEARRRVLGDEHPYTLSTVNNLARAYHLRGRHAQARKLYEEGLAIKLRIPGLGPEHRDTLVTRSNLAALDLDEGRLAEAEETLTAVLDEQRALHGEGHRRTLTTAHRLARVYLATGRPEQAERLFTRALEAARASTLPADHQLVGWLLAGQGRALAASGRWREAESALTEGHGILLRALGEDHDRTREAAAALAGLPPAPQTGWPAR